MSASSLPEFQALSRVLTGEARLDAELAGNHLERLEADPDAALHLPALLDRWRQIVAHGGDLVAGVRQGIVGDAVFAALAKRIILLWYTSALRSPDGQLEYSSYPALYFSALMWPAMGAHPPALSGGYFGHWRYPPESR